MTAPVLKGFRVGGLLIDPPLLLAPMAGITHLAFRQLVVRYGGCGLFMSEMLSARAVPHENPTRSFFLKRGPDESPFFYQLVGNDPGHMTRAIQWLEQSSEEAGIPVNGFDINMGCAAPPIRNSGRGVGLMKTPGLAGRIVSACRRVTRLPLTAKLRLGWEESFDETLAFVRILENEGIDAVTLHPRLAKEKFTRRARWEYVMHLKRAAQVPLIGNGDIRSETNVFQRLQETGCDGVMIGRLAVQKPWIFGTTSGAVVDSIIDLRELYLEFARLLTLECPEERRIGRLREFTPYYALNFRFGHRLASAVQNAPTLETALEEAARFFERNSDELLVRTGMDLQPLFKT